MSKLVRMYFKEASPVDKSNVYHTGNIHHALEINFINIFITYILIYTIKCPKEFVGFFLSKRSPETAPNEQSSTNKQLTTTILYVMVKVKATISYLFRKVVYVRVRNVHPKIFYSRYNC